MGSDTDKNILKTGTTTVGILCKDGIVLAADKRATAGYLVAQKDADKVHQITENIAVTMAGTVSDAQLLIKLIQAEARLKGIQTGRMIQVKEVANLTSRMVYNNIRQFSSIPGITQFIMGGRDLYGFHLYDLFVDGSISDIDEYVSSGSGSTTAYGVLETLYTKNLSVDEGIKLALKSLHAALQRDSASGSGYDVVTITEKGVQHIIGKEINTVVSA